MADGEQANDHTYIDEFNTDIEGKSERWFNRYDAEWIKLDGRGYFVGWCIE
ncbi:MAG: hypothetical protein Q8R44_01700 [Novosphingobium sp.]|nr:hypothetical protein [Novosphingobium sp.]